MIDRQAVSQADGYAERTIADAITELEMIAVTELDRIITENRARGTQFHPDYIRAYPNGYPILPESND